MILSDKQILSEMEKGLIKIEPFDQAQLGTNSYDVRLGATLAIYVDKVLDCAKENVIQYDPITPAGYVLEPGILYLGSTLEYTESLNHVPLLEGCSSIGRLGVNIHATAGFGDVGFKNHWTLELSVVQPVRVYAGQIIGQLYWVTCGVDMLPQMGLGEVRYGNPPARGFLQTYDQKLSAKYNTRSPLPQPSQAYKKFSEAEIMGIAYAQDRIAVEKYDDGKHRLHKTTAHENSTLVNTPQELSERLDTLISEPEYQENRCPRCGGSGTYIGAPIPTTEYPENTVGYWLSKIEDKEIRENALAYAERNENVYETEMLSYRDALCAMCDWRNTYEGANYWEAVWEKL